MPSVLSPEVRRELNGPEFIPGERWLACPSNVLIEVSDLGRVRVRATKALLHQTQEKRGYKVVQFKVAGRWKKVRVHNLVADTFLYQKHPMSALRVLHRDLNLGNNAASNLRYATGGEIAEYYHLLAHVSGEGASRSDVEASLPETQLVETPDGVRSATEPWPEVLMASESSNPETLYPSDAESAALFAEVSALYAAAPRAPRPAEPTPDPAAGR